MRQPSADPAPPRLAEPEAGQTSQQQHEGLRAVASIHLHCNIHASHIFSQYITTLPRTPPPPPSPELAAYEQDADDGAAFLAQILPGDRLAVVACAQYPMWVNAVRGCAIKVEIKAI